MEDQKYEYKMFQEFMKANNIKADLSEINDYLDMFINWLEEKESASRKYAGLVHNMGIEGDNSSKRVVEFNKGLYDTAMIGLKDLIEVPPVIVSPYADTLRKIPEIEATTGNLVCFNNDVFVGYRDQSDYFEAPNCTKAFGNDIGTLLTQTPFTIEELAPYLLLLNTDKTIFIGTNGNRSDKDKNDNINTIINLYKQLKTIEGRQVKFNSTTESDSYLATLKISPKEKQYTKKLY